MSLTSYWQHLCSAALLGTDRQALPPVEGTLLKYVLIPSKDKETALLNAAALVSLYIRSGQSLKPSSHSPLELAPPLNIPADPKEGRMLFDQISQKGDLWREWLDLSIEHQIPPPVGTLHKLLELGKSASLLRPQISQVIGPRGHWLAKFLDAQWLTPENLPDALWEEGNLKERVAYLSRRRSEIPEQARTMLLQVWKQENAEARTGLLEVLWQALSLSDEVFLESCLDDKSKRVHEVASEMLCTLPESALVKRMTERAQTLIVSAKGKLNFLQRLTGKEMLEVNLPEVFDKAMQRDGLEEKNMPYQMGQKQWWFQQIVARVPPSSWGNLATVVLCVNKEWRPLLIQSFIQATLRFRDQQAFLQLRPLLTDEQFEVFIPMMLQEELERQCIAFLQQNPKQITWNSPVLRLLQACHGPLGQGLEKALLEAIARFSASDTEHWSARILLETIQTKLSPSHCQKLESWTPLDSQHSLYEPYQRCLQILELRKRMYRYFGVYGY